VGFVGDFFTVPNPKVIPNSSNSTALPIGNLTATFTAPTAPTAPSFNGNFYTNLTTSNYQVQFGAAGAYTVTRLNDNQTVASGTGAGVVSFDGVDLNIAVVGASGDKFVLKPVDEAGRNIEIDSRIASDPRLIAAGAPARATQSLTNTGSMTVSQGIVGVGYSVAGLPVTLTALAGGTLSGAPGAWTAVYSNGTTTSGPGNVPVINGAATLSKISFSGLSFDIAGTPATGDTFSLQRNTSGVQDGRNAVLFAKLQTQNTVAGGAATFQSSYARLVADNGIRTREAKVKLDAQGAVLNQAEERRDSLSGVNLDEEAANMLRFQQAYQASSKILEIGSKLFDTILSIG
jgi:flagellar hook-associated protein 1 FlgK